MLVSMRLALFTAQAAIATALSWVLNLALLRLVWRRHPVPGDKTISPRWLTKTLRDRGVLDATNEVNSIELTDLNGARGYAGAMTRLIPTYSRTVGREPRSLVLKMSPSSFTFRKRTIVGGHAREPMFYSKANTLAPPTLPPVSYWSYGSHLLGEYAVLQEDLQEIKAVPMPMIFGNQVFGVPVPPSPSLDPVSVLRRVFISMADMHAAHWRSKELMKMTWLKSVDWYHGGGRARWEIAVNFSRNCWQGVCAQRDAPGAVNKWQLSPKLRDIVTRSFAETSWAKLQQHLHDPLVPFTLTHGDLHANNMRFLPSLTSPDIVGSGRVILFDWSEIGPWEPTADLGQMLISDVKPAIFCKHSRELVQAYYDRLVELGVREESYTFERCWAAFCRGCVEKWVWMFAIMTIFPIDPSLMQYFNDQILAFIEAHNPQPSYPLKSVVSIA